MWIYILLFIIALAALLVHLNRNYFILAICPRIKVADGSSLEKKVYTIPGTTIFGNNFDILAMNPETIFEYCRRNAEYSKGKSYLLYFLLAPIYSITHAEDAEEVFQNQNLITKSVIYDLVKPFLGDGLLNSTDKKWHFHRKTLTPAFHFNILQSFLEVFKEECLKVVKKLDDIGEDILTLTEIIPEFTLNNICETALGIRLDSIEGSTEYRHAIHAIERSIVKRVCNPLKYFDIIYYLFGDYRQMHKNLDIAHNFSSKIIKKKREEFRERMQYGKFDKIDEHGKKKRYALLDTLLDVEQQGEIDHNSICDEVNTFMFEGYDTTSTCLIFTLLNLALRQDIQEKCFKEVEKLANVQQLKIFDFNQMEYLECVIKETLRLYPSVPYIGRQCVEKTTVNGLILPKNTQVNVHIFDIMRDPKHFPDPMKFDPSRFFPENTEHRHPFAFVPFSAGPRNCIGQKFAILEMKVLLVSIIQNFMILPVTRLEDIVFENGLVLRSQQPLKIRLRKRM